MDVAESGPAASGRPSLGVLVEDQGGRARMWELSLRRWIFSWLIIPCLLERMVLLHSCQLERVLSIPRLYLCTRALRDMLTVT